MPFLDDFAQSFTSTVNTFAGIKSDKRKLEEDRRQFDTSFGETQRQFDTQQQLEREKWDTMRPGVEAETDLRREQTRGAAFENSPEQQGLRTRATEAAIDKVYGDIELQQAQIPLIHEQVKTAAHANTEEQRQLATENLKATTDNLVKTGQLHQAQADEINARVPFIPAMIDSEIRSRDATTAQTEADTRLKTQEADIGEGKVDMSRRLMERRRLMDRWGMPDTPAAPEGAIPETGAQNRGRHPTADTMMEEVPPNTSMDIGPQSGAIPDGGASVQQASMRTSSPAGGGGNVIQAQAGTRNQPLNDQTLQMLQDAGVATGLDVRVKSGGQPSYGSNRTGSHRHDTDVGAADVELIDVATGKALSMAVPEEQARIANFIRAARAAGATGIGAGREYMGDSTIHVGFGEEAVWGGKGKRENAPEWLVEAFNNSAIPDSRATSGSNNRQGSDVFAALQQRLPFLQSAIMAGNVQQESGGNPLSLNEGEGAFGIMQWRLDRRDKLDAFAAERGTDPGDLQTQIDYMIEEGTKTGSAQDKAAWAEFTAATTPEAANAALKKFIRYGDNSAGTRLANAKALMSGGPSVLPTPRGGIRRDLNRAVVAQSGTTAAKEALKAIYAGMQIGGAMPTQQSQSQMRATLMGQGAARNNEMNNAHTAVQQAYPPGVKVSEAERNLATLGMAYEWALYIDEDPAKAQMYATEILQNYRQTHNQLMSFAQQSLEDGKLDQAAKLAAKAYAYIPDGQEAKFIKDKDGNYIVTTIDLATRKETSRQRVSPDQMYAKIMGWSPIEFERRLASAAGVSMPSKAFEQASGMLAGAIPEVTYQGNEPQAIPPTPQFNRAGMTSEEGSAIEQQYTNYEAQRAELNKGLTPPDPTARQDTNDELAKLVDGNVPAETVDMLTQTFGNGLNGVISNMLQSNPTAIAESIADDLQIALNTAQAEQGLPFEVMNGDYAGHKKIRIGNNEYNVRSNVAATIINGINRKLRSDVEGRFAGAVDEFGNRLQRGIAGAQTEKLLGRALPERGNNPNWRRDMSRGVIPTQ